MAMGSPSPAPRIDVATIDSPAAVPVQRTRRRWPWISGACIAIFALLTLAAVPLVVVRVHRATIDLYPAEEPFVRVVPFAVSADTAAANADGSTLQTHPVTTNVAREADLVATGTKRVPDATAVGTVTLR